MGGKDCPLLRASTRNSKGPALRKISHELLIIAIDPVLGAMVLFNSKKDSVHVFVNGQLMVSSANTPGNGDYSGGGSSTSTIKFEFQLEPDDVISFTKSPI